jgi:multicomponent Na+:H+ antiporter subunit E
MTALRKSAHLLGKIPRLLGFLGFFVFELVHSSLRVAHDVITPRDQGQPAIVCVPLDVTSDLEIALLASLVTLTPGTLALGLSEDRRSMLVHAMFAPDSDELRREIKEGYERRVQDLLS